MLYLRNQIALPKILIGNSIYFQRAMLSVGRGRFLIPVLLLLFLPHETQGMDGCEGLRWRCNDECIRIDVDCQCGDETLGSGDETSSDDETFVSGDETFGYDDLKWCCNNVAINLSQNCEGQCNYYPNDEYRNERSARSFVPVICGGNKTTCVQEGEGSRQDLAYKQTICTGKSSCDKELVWCREEERREEKCPTKHVHCPGIRSNKKTGNSTKSIPGQCVDRRKLEDGEVNDCLDRSDEKPLEEGEDSTIKDLAIINLDRLEICTGEGGDIGLECGEQEHFPSSCMPMLVWCLPGFVNFKCPVLGTNSRDIYTNNPTICANTTFWRQKPCGKWYGEVFFRCKGNYSGQCVSVSNWGDEGSLASCRDGSDKYRLIKQPAIKEENPNHQTASIQTWNSNNNESNPFKVPPSYNLPGNALNREDYAKDKTTNLTMAAPTEETCNDNEGFSCQGRLCDNVC